MLKRHQHQPIANRGFSIWGFLPGLAFLAGAIYWAFAAANDFLEPPLAAVPDVTGKTLTQAVEILTDAHLRLSIEENSDTSRERDVVLAQNPNPGGLLPEGRVVILSINRPRRLSVPNLIGTTLEEAKLDLETIGLRLQTLAAEIDAQADTVAAQNPESGENAVQGTTVTVLIPKKENKVKYTYLPPLAGLPLETARRLVTSAGLKLSQVNFSASREPANTVLSQTPEAYKRVAVGSLATLTIVAVPRQNGPIVIGSAKQTFDFSYTVPEGFTDANVEIKLNDQNSEKTVLGPEKHSSGDVIELKAIEIQGTGTFIVLIDGQEVWREARP